MCSSKGMKRHSLARVVAMPSEEVERLKNEAQARQAQHEEDRCKGQRSLSRALTVGDISIYIYNTWELCSCQRSITEHGLVMRS